MKIAAIAPLSYTPGELEYFQFIRDGVGADYQGPSFFQFADGVVRTPWCTYDFDECSPNLAMLYSDSRDRGLTWSASQVYLAECPAGPLGGPVLGLHNGREAIMYVAQARHEIEVDGICQIWLDGETIGSQLEPPEVMWNRPFTIAAGRLAPGRKHRLVVDVTTDKYGAGIWRPVGLMEGLSACAR